MYFKRNTEEFNMDLQSNNHVAPRYSIIFTLNFVE